MVLVYHFSLYYEVMKTRWLVRIYMIGILVILCGVMFHAPLSVGFGHVWPDYALIIKAWKEILLGALLIIAVVLVSRRKLWPELLRDRLIQLMAVYGLLHLLLLPLSSQGWSSIIAGLMIDLRFVLFFVLFYVLVKLDPRTVSHMVKVFFIGVGVVIGFGVLQITVLPDDILRSIGYSTTTISPYSTIDKNPDFVRINSTLRGPNPLGAFCVIVISLLGAYGVKARKQLTYQKWGAILAAIAASGAVLFASYSRSAYAALLIALAALVPTMPKRRWSGKIIGGSVLAAVIVGVFSFMSLQSSDWYQNVVVHEDPESSVVKKSNGEHVRSLRVSIARADHPATGRRHWQYRVRIAVRQQKTRHDCREFLSVCCSRDRLAWRSVIRCNRRGDAAASMAAPLSMACTRVVCQWYRPRRHRVAVAGLGR